jgi:flagellar motor switch protein FliN
VNADEALLELAASTAEAVPSTLGMYGVADVVTGKPQVLADGAPPFAGLPAPGVATSVGYEGGVTGGNVLGISLRGARMLAAAMMGQDPSSIGDDATELTELEQSAVAEAMNQIMAAAAAATSAVIETEIDIGPPETRALATAADAEGMAERASHVVATGLTVLGEPCRLVQLVPNAFVVRMTRALDELEAEIAEDPSAAAGAAAGTEAAAIGGALMGTKLRVWAEVGRAKLPVGRVVGLPAGAVLELDRLADDPVDVFVNGHRYATGRLVVEADGEWAVRLESILTRPHQTPQEVH